MIRILTLIVIIANFAACQSNNMPGEKTVPTTSKEVDKIIYTSYSNNKSDTTGFSSYNAINRIADIENEYFNAFETGYSKYYGTKWFDLGNRYAHISDSLCMQTDSMHCTIYAIEALKAGFGENSFDTLVGLHKGIWKDREYAGWSIGYLLVTKHKWKAYLILDSVSPEFDQCVRHFKKYKSYPVWKQPDIPLDNMFILGRDSKNVDSLLNRYEFGWGFSYQGYHTWITRYNVLKECNWNGSPSALLDDGLHSKLFLKTNFLDYHDYGSHVVIFPPD